MTKQQSKEEFYQEQIRKFEELSRVCSRPDRVQSVIEIYKQELEKSK